jgi:hypothetical protein
MEYTSNDKIIEIGMDYCRSQKNEAKCPLLHKPCISSCGDFLDFYTASLEDVQDMLNVYANWINDNDLSELKDGEE